MTENLLNASDTEIAQFVAEHAEEFGTSDVSAELILRAIAEGRMAIERRDYGFAVLEVEDRPGWLFSPGANLCYLYILPKHRYRGVGKVFVRELIDAYAKQYLMSLWVSEVWRIEFYESCGFRVVEELDDGSFRMEMVESDDW